MAKTIILLFFSFFFISSSQAQSESDRVIYYDSIWKETSKENHRYYRIIKDYSSSNDIYEVSDYFKSGKLQMSGHSTERGFLKKTGEFIFYYENGNKSTQANYENSILVGHYDQWYENGMKKLEGEYSKSDNPENPENIFKIINYWNTNNTQLVTEGNGYFAQTENQVFEEGALLNGMPDGEWKGGNLKTNSSYVENYKKGKLVSGVSKDSLNKKYPYTELVTKPKPRKGIQHFYKFISKNLKIPREAANVYGKIFLNFVVERDGDVKEFHVLKSLGSLMDAAAMKVIRDYPEWEPGTSRGIYARFSYSIPINIAPPR